MAVLPGMSQAPLLSPSLRTEPRKLNRRPAESKLVARNFRRLVIVKTSREWRVLTLCGLALALAALPAWADPELLVSNVFGPISRFTLSGTPLGTINPGVGQIAGLATRDQIIFVTGYDANVVRSFDVNGNPLATLSPGDGPVGMAFDANGNLFVSNQRGNSIRKFAPDGTDLGLFVSTGLTQPWGLAFDADGNLYVACRGANQIRKYTSDGVFIGVFASAGLEQPIGIAFDALGNLLVASFGNSTIRKFSPAGSDLGVFASSGVSAPTEIVFDDDWNLYVANLGSGSVRVFAANGTDLGFLVTGLSSPQGIAIRRDSVGEVSNLQVSALKGKSVAGAGLPYAAKDTTRNAGPGNAPSSATQFYLSTDNRWDAGDMLLVPLTGRIVPVLTDGATSTGTTMLTMPADLAPSKWFLIAKADGEEAIAESNELDNTRAKVVYVGPDLQVKSLTTPAGVSAGQVISVTTTTKNIGGAPTTTSTTTRLYLSTDKKLSAADVALGPGRAVPVLAAGATSISTASVTIPVGTAPGAYYLLGKADDGGVEAESRETNNVKAVAITVH